MALSIRNPKAERLARELAGYKGETVTEAIIRALEERLERERGRRTVPDLEQDILAISDRCSRLPTLDQRSAEEILGYNEAGLPA